MRLEHYIPASPTTLSVGSVSTRVTPGFTAKYQIRKLLYHEELVDPLEGIAREKQIKGWLRRKKIALIESMNPAWKDLSADW